MLKTLTNENKLVLKYIEGYIMTRLDKLPISIFHYPYILLYQLGQRYTNIDSLHRAYWADTMLAKRCTNIEPAEFPLISQMNI